MANAFKKTLGELLLEKKIIDRKALDEAIAVQKKSGKRLGKILVEKGFLDEKSLFTFLEEQLEVNFKTRIDAEPKPEVFHVLPYRYCKKKGIAPYEVDHRTIRVFTSEPTNTALLNEISFMTGKNVEVDYAIEGAIADFLGKFSGETTRSSQLQAKGTEGQPPDEKPGEEELDDSPVVRFVDETIRSAIERKASDIHFEVYERKSVLRYRIDGVLYQIDEPELRMYPAIVSRIKILAELDISEKRLPQDGRINMRHEDRPIDIRVSIIPTVHGENAVLRILDKGKKASTFEEIGFAREMVDLVQKEARKPNGMILVTGPTGSGKTTTLYAVLQYVKQFENKILTVEDPVEYQVEGISQVQVHSDIGLTFAAGLRAFLRHDPDVIMVGEIRDKETADISVRAALTGHLVLSTVHTNDAASSITRFIDMGIPPYLITSTINLIIAQRLVRRICPKCRTEKELTADAIALHGIGDVFQPGDRVFYGKGCSSCNNSGYQGRIPMFEFMRITDKIKNAVLHEASSFELKSLAKSEGMLTLRDSGLELVKDGHSTLEEIEKIVSLGE
jgi:type IV pilus assembly protein PilB